MIQVIRGAITSFVQGVYRKFTATGRVGETFSGTSYQHYGFSSHPPVDTEVIAIQYDNNDVAVAENDGNLKPDLDEGDVALYMRDQTGGFNGIILQPNGNSITIMTTDGNIQIAAEGTSQINVFAPNVYIGVEPGDESNAHKVLLDTIQNIFNNHVHQVATSGTAAAQAGTTSSPCLTGGTEPIAVVPLPGPPIVATGAVIGAADMSIVTLVE